MDYKSFCRLYKPSESEIFTEFYHLFKDKFSVKNERIAIDKLQKIIKATFKLSAHQSFAQMSLRQLSKHSGLSMGGLYAYIQNKQQLSLFIHQFLNEFVIKIINKVEANAAENTLEDIIRAHIYLSEIMHPWFFFAFMESKNLSQNERKFAIQSELLMENKLIDAIEYGQEVEVYNGILSAQTLASLIKPLLHEWYLKRWKYKQRKVSIDDFCFSVMIFIERGLTSPHSLTEHSENADED
jgi:AcrR family transcriptional regulator